MRNGLIIESDAQVLNFYRETAKAVLPMTSFCSAQNIDEALAKAQKQDFHLIIYANKTLDNLFFSNIKKLKSQTSDPVFVTINQCEKKSSLTKLFSNGVKGCILSTESNGEMARLLSVLKYGIAPVSPRVVDILTDKDKDKLCATDDMVQLTNRENDVFDLLCKGLTNKYIAKSLNLSVYTVADHVKSIFKKMNVHSRTALISQQLNIN